MKTIKNILTLSIILLTISACKKFSEVPPPKTEITGDAIFTTDATAEAALNGIYLSMQTNSFGGGETGISILTGLSADEVALFPGASLLEQQIYTNSQLSSNYSNIWFDCYTLIYDANAAINGIPSSNSMSTAVKQQLLGEALFLRAYSYFYLLNLYGDVPLVISTNYQTNKSLSRTPQKQVYQQMVADLTQAETLLSDNYLTSNGTTTTERVRPNKEAVAALLARVYLYTEDWSNAIKQATQVTSSGIYSLVSDPNQVFLAGSNEAIWQLEEPATDLSNTPDGIYFTAGPSYYGGPNFIFPDYMSNDLAQSFEKGDLRRKDWVDSISENGINYYYPYKYKLNYTGQPPLEYPIMLRLAEQYLILSEAYAHAGQPANAITNLNIIRNRAGLSPYTGATDSASVLKAVFRERRSELFTENGHRWFDLRRSGSINSVMTPACQAKGGAWNSNDQLYPIPLPDMEADPNLKQNPGYN